MSWFTMRYALHIAWIWVAVGGVIAAVDSHAPVWALSAGAFLSAAIEFYAAYRETLERARLRPRQLPPVHLPYNECVLVETPDGQFIVASAIEHVEIHGMVRWRWISEATNVDAIHEHAARLILTRPWEQRQ